MTIDKAAGLDAFLKKNYHKLISPTLDDYEVIGIVEQLIVDFPTADVTFIVFEQLFRDILVEQEVVTATQAGDPASYFVSQLKTANYLEEQYCQSSSERIRIARKLLLIRKYMAIRLSYATMHVPRMLDVRYVDSRLDELLSEPWSNISSESKQLYDPLLWYVAARKKFLMSFIADRELRTTGSAVEHFISYHRFLQDHQNAYDDNSIGDWFHLEEFYGVQQASPYLLNLVSQKQERDYTASTDDKNWNTRRLMRYRKVPIGRDSVERLNEEVCAGTSPEPDFGGICGVRFAACVNVAAFTRIWDTTESLRLRLQVLREYPNLNDQLLAFQYYRLAELYSELGNYQEALDYIDRCLVLNPADQLNKLAVIAKAYYEKIISDQISQKPRSNYLNYELRIKN